jgi:tetratricopeptide (TPR) repeat protein
MLVDLSTTPVARVLSQVSAERRTGDLQIRAGKVVKTVFLDGGRMVFAASNLKKDRLGEALMALGRITSEEFERASTLMREGEHRRRFGEALIKSGVMDKDELGRSVAKQVKRIILSLFEYAEGLAVFEERPCSIPLEYMVSLSVHRMLYIGIKTMKSRDLILTGLGDLDRWVSLAAVPPFSFGVRKCSAEELEILEQARNRVTLRRLAWAPGGLSLNRMRIVYALVASGLLQETDQAAQAPQPVLQMETSTFLLSALRSRPDPSARDAIRQEVAGELERSSRQEREAWLKVSRQAPRDELIRALEEKMERYHQLLEASGDDEQLKTEIELVLGRASTMVRAVRQQQPPGQAVPPSPPPAEVAPPPPPPRRPAEKVSAPVERAPAPAEKVTAPPSEKDAMADKASAPAVAAAAESATSNMAVEHLLMEGEVRMTVSDYANAIKVYAKLVDLAPDVALYRAKLAISMAFHPPTAKQAEREFLEAVRLEPNNPDLHYQFALYYKAMKVKSRAITELETAVRLNPRHRLARTELEAMAPKDSALTNLKKLFR